MSPNFFMYHLANIPVSIVGPLSPEETITSLKLDIINNDKLILRSDVTGKIYYIDIYDPAIPVISCLLRDNHKDAYSYSFKFN